MNLIRRNFLAVAGAGLLALVVVATPRTGLARSAVQTTAWLAGGLVDYAPSGVPDFSVCRPEWSRPGEAGQPGQWTHAGPLALADTLWWLDSVAEPMPRPPTSANDGHGLVVAYPAFGPARDDHAAANLGPLIEDLAFRLNTDGLRKADRLRGTRWEELADGAAAYVAARRLATTYRVEATQAPDVPWLAARVGGGAGVVVALGVWERQAEGWRRVGGHYAAVAGLDVLDQRVALADPLADNAALDGAGRLSPPDVSVHSCRIAPRAHDDAAVVSHDLYHLGSDAGLPGDRHVLDGYFTLQSTGEAAAFRGQNPIEALRALEADWQGGAVVMALDAALAIVPTSAALPTPTPPPPVATATPTDDSTRTPSATPTLVVDVPGTPGGLPWPTPRPTVRATVHRLYLPRVERRS